MTNQALSLIHAFAMKMGEAGGTMHNLSVGFLAGRLAELLIPERAHVLYVSGLMHDIGGIGIFEDLVREPVLPALIEPDTALPEAKELFLHPRHSYNMLRDIGVDCIGVLDHHELMDGTGYPQGKRADEVTIEGYIMGICDKIDLLLQRNPFHKKSVVTKNMRDWKARLFPPHIVEAAENIIAGDKALLYDLHNFSALQQRTWDFERRHSFDDILQTDELRLLHFLAFAIELKHPCTMDHSTRVSMLATEIARRLSLPPDDLALIQKASYLHDIGKIAIPRGVLMKPTALTPSERDLICLHVVKGYELLNMVPMTKPIALIAESHHESYAGEGYPLGLVGNDIPFLSRIITVVDIFDALTSVRSYRKAFSAETALSMMEQQMMPMFDPALFHAAKTILKEVHYGLHETR